MVLKGSQQFHGTYDREFFMQKKVPQFPQKLQDEIRNARDNGPRTFVYVDRLEGGTQAWAVRTFNDEASYGLLTHREDSTEGPVYINEDKIIQAAARWIENESGTPVSDTNRNLTVVRKEQTSGESVNKPGTSSLSDETEADRKVHEEMLKEKIERAVALNEKIQELEEEREKEMIQGCKEDYEARLKQLRDDAGYKTEAELSDLLTQLEEFMNATPGTCVKKPAADAENSDCMVCMNKPTQIFVCEACQNWVCQDCSTKVKNCPSCRSDLEKEPLKRNKAVERALKI